jgi:hypothetical protein
MDVTDLPADAGGRMHDTPDLEELLVFEERDDVRTAHIGHWMISRLDD